MNTSEIRSKEMLDRLRAEGHRITPQRLAVLRLLAESSEHPSVEDIYEAVRKTFPTTSLATVYKTISVLKQMGEVLEIEFSKDSNRYDGNRPHPHPHLICVRCKKIVDPDLASISHITNELTSETGFKVIGYRLDVQGICPECQKKS